MARATSRLDIYLIPTERCDSAVERVRERFDAWAERGIGAGEAELRIDDPGRVILYANQLGGYQVRCPNCETGLARVLKPMGLTLCPACGAELPFDAIRCDPPASLGRAALVAVDVQEAVWDDPEGWRVVLRRM